MQTDDHEDRKKDVEESTKKVEDYCPTCGQKISASTTGGGSVGSAAGGGG